MKWVSIIDFFSHYNLCITYFGIILTLLFYPLCLSRYQRSPVSWRSHQGPCSPQRPAVTGLRRTRGLCGAAWEPTPRLLSGGLTPAPVRALEAWDRGSATKTLSVAATRGRRAICCCWVVPLCWHLSRLDKTCCSSENCR